MKISFEKTSDEIELKVTNALNHLLNECPGQYISISKVCRLAEVSRANLYSTYPTLLAKIRAANTVDGNKRKTTPPPRTGISSPEDVKRLEKRVKVLALLCIELQGKNELLASRLAAVQRKKATLK
jgi:hypothetical protein